MEGCTHVTEFRSCTTCRSFREGKDPFDGYVRCAKDEMARKGDKHFHRPDSMGRPPMIDTYPPTKRTHKMPTVWIRQDVAETKTAQTCEVYG